MTGALDTPMRQAAQDMLSDLGRNVTYRRTTKVYNPDTRRTTDSAVTHTVTVSPPLDVRFSRLMSLDTSLVDVKGGDMLLYLAAKGADITPDGAGEDDKDEIQIDSVWWSLIDYGPVYSGEKIALYELIMRRSGA